MNVRDRFAPSFQFLQLEAFLIESSLLSGLDHLRKARLDTRGDFYTAFFQLSIGLERLLKCIFVAHFMSQNRLDTPTNGELRKFGHHLTKLFDYLVTIPTTSMPNPLSTVGPDSLERAILETFDEFATTSRYHNLDSLAGKAVSTNPLKSWNRIIQRIVVEDIRAADKERISRRCRWLNDMTRGIIVMSATDLDQKPIGFLEAAEHAGINEIASRYAVFHVLNLIRAGAFLLTEKCDEIENLAHQAGRKDSVVPYMHDFFKFIHYDRNQILRKKRWP